jgi:hypothetical protein
MKHCVQKWLQHQERIPETQIPKTLYQCKLNDKEGQYCPTERWKEQLYP